MMNSVLKKIVLSLFAFTSFYCYGSAKTEPIKKLTSSTTYLNENKRGFLPSRKIILKLDDLYSSFGVSTASSTLDYLVSMKVKAGLGFVSSRNDATALSVYSTYFNAKNLAGDPLFEVWHHGFDHINPEFDGTTYAYQKQHFEDADAWSKNNLRVQMHSFGAPYNHTDATTNTVISENSNYKVTMFSYPAPNVSTGILNLTNRVNMEDGTGNPDYNFFVANYNASKTNFTDYMVLQGHPGQWGASEIAQFSQIIDFLITEGVEFVTPYEYYLSLNPTVVTPTTSQTITFPALTSKTKEDADFNPGATSTSGLIVTYNSSNPAVAIIVNGNIQIVGAGTTVITASQMGNATYKSADYVSQTLSVYSIDYRSASSGNWNTPSTWQVRATNGSWSTATVVPDASNNVYIQNGHTITVSAAEAKCYDLNINATSSGAQGTLDLTSAFNINVNGKIRAYTGVAEVSAVDGVYVGTSTTSLISNMIKTNSTGILRFVGTSRNITNANEWNGIGTTNDAEFALDAGEIGILNTAVKFKTITFSSGIVSTNSTFNIGSSSTTFNGVLTIKNGAKLVSSKTRVSSGNQVFTYSNAVKCGTIVIDLGGVLELTGAAPAMDVVTFTNNGTVIYSGSAAQTLLNSANDPTSLKQFSYTNLIIDNVNGVSAVSSSANLGNFLNNGGTLTLNRGVFTTGNLTVPSGAISVIRTEGSLTAAITGIANVTYNGESIITSGVELPSSVNNLTINNPTEVTLQNSKTVTGTLTLTNGILNIPSTAELHISSGNSIVGSFSATNHIKTLKSGADIGALRLSSFTGSRTFPVGGSNYYLPVIFTPVGASDITISVFEDATTNAAVNGPVFSSTEKSDLVNAIYLINRTSGTGNYDLVLGWNAALEGTNFTGFADNQFSAFQYLSNDYQPILGIGSNSSNSITLTGLTNFAPLLIKKISTLPIQLTSFTAQKHNNGAQLKWTTSSELNNAYFEIQKSIDGLQFNNIGKIDGARNSQAVISYSFLDQYPFSGTNYYRLKQVDFDGKFTFSNVTSINHGFTNLSMIVYPSISSNRINININSAISSNGEITIYNTSGQKISNQKAVIHKGTNVFVIDMIDAVSGTYIAIFSNDVVALKTKFIK